MILKQILGYGDDEGYNVYSEPWRKESNLASNIYRPGKNIDKEAYGGQEDLDELRKTNRYVPSFNSYNFYQFNKTHVSLV